MSALAELRDILRLAAQNLSWIRRPWRMGEILKHIVDQGIGSLPIVTVSTASAGIVVSNEIAWHLNRALSTVAMIPGVTGQFILRELAIAIPALLLVSKVGASTTAEIGTMKVTDQIDALKLLKVDPVGYLVFPRWVASMVVTVSLTLVAVFVTLLCAMGVAILKFNFSALEYLNALRHFVGFSDVVAAILKALIFGAVTPIIACSYGLGCRGGAEGVGDATTRSVVTATIAVIVLDFVATLVFSQIL